MLTRWADENPEQLREFVQQHHRHLIVEMVQTGPSEFSLGMLEELKPPRDGDE